MYNFPLVLLPFTDGRMENDGEWRYLEILFKVLILTSPLACATSCTNMVGTTLTLLNLSAILTLSQICATVRGRTTLTFLNGTSSQAIFQALFLFLFQCSGIKPWLGDKENFCPQCPNWVFSCILIA